jgi:hypothetical protein
MEMGTIVGAGLQPARFSLHASACTLQRRIPIDDVM